LTAKRKFIAILAGLSLPPGAARAGAGIIDKDIETIAVLAERVGEATHFSE